MTENATEATTVDTTGDESTEDQGTTVDLSAGEPTTPDIETADDQETFPRSYVEKLRRESAGYRDAQPAETHTPNDRTPN